MEWRVFEATDPELEYEDGIFVIEDERQMKEGWWAVPIDHPDFAYAVWARNLSTLISEVAYMEREAGFAQGAE